MEQFLESSALIAPVLIMLAMVCVSPAITQPCIALPVNKMGMEVSTVLFAMLAIGLIVLIKNAMVAQPIAQPAPA